VFRSRWVGETDSCSAPGHKVSGGTDRCVLGVDEFQDYSDQQRDGRDQVTVFGGWGEAKVLRSPKHRNRSDCSLGFVRFHSVGRRYFNGKQRVNDWDEGFNRFA